jgi:ABC-type multidrug transport system ATPase subunit
VKKICWCLLQYVNLFCRGLDIVAIKQCISMLKLLARQGRTIICTIHQPTASHFQLFDQVYVLAKGQCVYQGASQQLVPFLSSVGLRCPKHYNPADYGKYNV